VLRTIFSIGLVVSALGSSAAPTVWGVASGGNGHAYEVIGLAGGISWDDARAAARAAGGDLASLTSAAENNFVFGLSDSAAYWYNFDAFNSIGPWLGGFQPGGSPEPAGGWQWVSGEAFAFSNWSPGQPDNFSGEDRLHYHLTGVGRAATWNDIQGSGGVLPRAYVVEYVPEPGASFVLACAFMFWVRRARAMRGRGR
jgi:hypothetical protein